MHEKRISLVVLAEQFPLSLPEKKTDEIYIIYLRVEMRMSRIFAEEIFLCYMNSIFITHNVHYFYFDLNLIEIIQKLQYFVDIV